jgi:hypothetical protein
MTDKESESETDSPMPEEERDPHAETWQEEQPPDDDFHDQGDMAVAATEEGATEESTASISPEEEAAAAKKRGTSVMVGALVVGALFIGGLVYTQFGGGKGSAPTNVAAIMNANEPAAPAAAGRPAGSSQAGPNATEYPVTPTTAEADITAIYNAGLGQTTAPAANAVVLPGNPGLDHTAEKNASAAATTSDVVTTTAPKPPANATPPVSAMAPNAAPPGSATEAKLAAAANPQPSPTPAPQAQNQPENQGAIETRLNDLAQQIEALRKNMEQTAQQAGQLAGRLETIQGSGGAPSALEGRLDRIEQEINGLAQHKEATPQAPVAAVTEPAEEKAFPAVSLKPRHVASRTRVKKTAHHKEKKQRYAGRKIPGGGWVLRAATPDAAWVSKGADSMQLLQIKVGDTLPGVGKVRAIRQSGDGWELVAARGTVR